ncbi:MAG: M14 family zinc carboxypeptidase [Deltaproteobacteria bacterium]|jgi:hypothetical protein
MTAIERFHPIGTPGVPWTQVEKDRWRSERSVQRSYRDEVLVKIDALKGPFEVQRYGALSVDADRYPQLAVRMAHASGRPWALVTGGVHGYETSGVQGALAFLAEAAEAYVDRVNLVVAPCVSPWGYEVIHRWNPFAVDPNRSFVEDSPAEECRAIMAYLAGIDFAMHIDLHETTDTDETEFRPALAARDGKAFEPGTIPDGFYLVDDAAAPEPAFQTAIIEAVEKVTHIAPADEAGQIIGSDVKQRGVIEYAFGDLGLCAGMTDARYTTTTEVYPDSPSATPEICNAAQVAAVRAALDFVLSV